MTTVAALTEVYLMEEELLYMVSLRKACFA